MNPDKILLVEDEIVISMSIEESLANLGYNNIHTAFNATTAYDKMVKDKFDIVLMDINLGDDKDGIDVMNEVKRKKNIPFVYLTGNSDARTIQKAKYSSPDGFIVKPFNEIDLKINVEFTLYKERTKQEELKKSLLKATDYKGTFPGLVMHIDINGQLHYVNDYIKKITGISPDYYLGKTLQSAGFGQRFFELINNILRELRNSPQRVFYRNISTPFIGEKMMEIRATPEGTIPNSYLLLFNDITDRFFKEPSGEAEIKIAVACNNPNIISGFRSIPTFIENSKIVAELDSSESAINFLKTSEPNLLVADIDVPGGCIEILEFIAKQKKEGPRVIVMAAIWDIERLKMLKQQGVNGYFSKTAGDETIMEAISCISKGIEYYDPQLKRFE